MISVARLILGEPIAGYYMKAEVKVMLQLESDVKAYTEQCYD